MGQGLISIYEYDSNNKNFIKRLRISPVDIFALIFFGIILITVFLFFYRKGEYVTIRVKVITMKQESIPEYTHPLGLQIALKSETRK